MRSISTKLILAFLSIGIISVAIIFITARWNTRVEFISFLSDQNQTDIITELSDYHFANGSWVGVETISVQRQPGFDSEHDNRKNPQAFTLADENGVVIRSDGKYKPGDKLTESDTTLGTLITENGKVVGIFVPLRMPFEGQPRELEFIERTIDTHIKNLRGKIESDPRSPQYIETVYGIGYRFKRE